MSDAGASLTADRQPALPRQVIELINRQVRLRFELKLTDFGLRLFSLTTQDSPDAPLPWWDRAARLCLDDLYLAWACVRGESAAWQELGATHFGFIRAFALRYLPRHAAVDVADEVIADLWERGKLERYQGRSMLRTWLGALVSNAALNAVKALQRGQAAGQARQELARSGESASSADEIAEREAADLLHAIVSGVLKTLPGESRLLLQLYYEQGLTLEEMSGTMRVSAAALSRRLKQTREDLRAAIETEARRTAGVPATVLRDGIDLARLEVDLGVVLREPVDG